MLGSGWCDDALIRVARFVLAAFLVRVAFVRANAAFEVGQLDSPELRPMTSCVRELLDDVLLPHAKVSVAPVLSTVLRNTSPKARHHERARQ